MLALFSFVFFVGFMTVLPSQAATPAIAAGGGHTIVLKSSGTVWTWGYNLYGQLGDGTITNRCAPVEAINLRGIIAIAGGGGHTLALKKDGTLWAWGQNWWGQLGVGDTDNHLTPVQVNNLTDIIDFSIGSQHTIALKNDGTVWTWGLNLHGELGVGTKTESSTPVQVQNLTNIIAIAVGSNHTVALKDDGTVWTWGYNMYGELGDGTQTESSTPVQVQNLTGITAIAAGGEYTIALKNDGTVWAWGRNCYGQLGDGSTIDRLMPIQVTNLSDISDILAGGSHVLVRKDDGSVWGWGWNSHGQLGDGTTTNRLIPVPLQDMTDFTAFAAGNVHTAALKEDGSVWAWGYNNSGQLGNCAINDNCLTPLQLGSFNNVTAIACGSSCSFAIKTGGTVWAWGSNGFGQLGDGSYENSLWPIPVITIDSITAIAAGGYHTVALKDDNTVWTWGSNYYGQLGDGTINAHLTPVQVQNLTGITAIAAGDEYTVALKNDGTVWAWGGNYFGQLGDGTTDDHLTPVQVQNLFDITAISAWGTVWSGHTVALKNDGTVWAWGLNEDGQLGDGTYDNRLTPVQVPNLTGIIAVAGGESHTVALKNDGTVWMWGWGYLPSPIQVQDLTSITAISTGYCHALALKDGGIAWAWGANWAGQLGDGTTDESWTPVQVQSLTGTTAIAAGADHSLALKNDGTVWAWGGNMSGQLGDGTIDDSYIALQTKLPDFNVLDMTPSTISCDSSKTSMVLGESFSVSGAITPAPTPDYVYLILDHAASESQVIYLTNSQTDGTFSFDVECEAIDVAGDWTVLTYWYGNADILEAESDIQTLTVEKAETRITLDTTSEVIKQDKTITLSGKLTPYIDCGGLNLEGLTVNIIIKRTGYDDLIYEAVTNDAVGHFKLENLYFDELGQYTIQAEFDDSESTAYEGAVSDTIPVQVVETAGYAIIVQGKVPGEEGLDAHNKTANYVYIKLRYYRGLYDDDIMYFNYDTNQPGVDAVPTKAGIQEAITTWARDRMDPSFTNPVPEAEVEGKPSRLYIIFVDHGTPETFHIYNTGNPPADNTITADDLNTWLTTLQGSLTGQAAEQDIITVLGFCYSGSFIPKLSGSLAGDPIHRVIITSAAADEVSYKGPEDQDGIRHGEYFVTEFFDWIAKGKTVKYSFEIATASTEKFTARGVGLSTNAPYYDASRQHPLLEDNGDGNGSNALVDGEDADGVVSHLLYIGETGNTGNALVT